MGGKLYHCWFCRLQFYDLRPSYKIDSAVEEGFGPPSEDKAEAAS
jgi:hypothetical protein